MFQFPRCPPRALCVQARAPRYHPRRVDPFGDPRIIACQPLPEALRRVAAPFVGPASRGIHLRAHPSSPATRLPRDGRAIGRAPTRGKDARPTGGGGAPHTHRRRRSLPCGAQPSLVNVLRPDARTSNGNPVSPCGWSRGDSNPQPPPCKGGALPTELHPRVTSRGRWIPARGARLRLTAPTNEPDGHADQRAEHSEEKPLAFTHFPPPS